MNNIEHDYLKLLHDILTNGVEKSDRTGTGTCSVFGRQIRHDMRLGFPLLTTKKMAWKSIVTELLWFLRGDTNIKYLVDNGCHVWDGDAYKKYQLAICNAVDIDMLSKEEFIKQIKTDDEFAAQWGELGPIYGRQWRDWNGKWKLDKRDTHRLWQLNLHRQGVDQIQNLINDLKTNPDSRRLMVSAWNVGELNKMFLPPCHYGFQVYTRELNLDERIDIYNGSTVPMNQSTDYFHEHMDSYGIPRRAISLSWNQRSVDTPLGLPFNIASYALLLEMLAMETGMVAEELIGNLGDCHIYNNQIEGVKEQLTRSPMLLGKLIINNEFWNPDSKVFNQQDMRPGDFIIEGYESHPAIKFPLSN